MSEVVALGYLGLTAPDVEQFETFSSSILGMQVTPNLNASASLLRMDERAWRIALDPGPGGLSYCGWEVANGAQLDALANRLDSLGVVVKASAELAEERMVSELVICNDPGGNQLEFFYGADIPQDPFRSPLGRRFVTGSQGPGDMGLGHVGLLFEEVEAARHFYMDVLGFRLSDTIFGAPFLHVNRRHHSLVIGGTRGAVSPGLHHLMVEVEDIDMVGDSLDRVADNQVPLSLSLGKHTNDRMVSFYVTSPAGFDVEYGYGARQVDDQTWSSSSYKAISFWGHKQQIPVVA